MREHPLSHMTLYRIGWRPPYRPNVVSQTTWGAPIYPTAQAAWDQVTKYRATFPNRYYVEPVKA